MNANENIICPLSRKLFKLDEPDTQDTAGEAGTNSSEMYSYGPPHMAVQKQDNQLEHTFSSYVRIYDDNFNNVSLLPPLLVCALSNVLSNWMVLLHFVLKYLICGTKESLWSKIIPRYLQCSIFSTGSRWSLHWLQKWMHLVFSFQNCGGNRENGEVGGLTF